MNHRFSALPPDEELPAYVGVPIPRKPDGKAVVKALPPKASRSLRICLVEDHPDTLASITNYLVHRGHQVVGATSVGEAVEAFGTQTFELLISDIMLKDGTGWQLLERIDMTQVVFAVAISGRGMPNDRRTSKIVGFRHHLLKPVNPAAIEKILSEAIKELPAK